MRRLTAALTILICACTTTPASIDVDQAIYRWSNAIGGRSRIAEAQSVYREATIEMGGLTGTLKLWEAATGAYRSEVEFAGVRDVEAFDGTTGWKQSGTAAPHALGGPDLERAVTRAFMNANAPFFPGARPGYVSVAGQEGKYVVLSIEPAGGREMQVFLDPDTWLPHAFTQLEQERTATTTVLQWTFVRGLRFPQELTESTGDKRFETHIQFGKTQTGVPIQVALFTRPQVNARSYLPSSTREVSIPFVLAQNHIHFPVSVNGNPPSDFLLDTGADASVIDRAHAEDLKLALKGSVEARGAGTQSVETALIAAPHIAFSGIDLPLDELAAFPLGALSLREGRAMHGILGYDVLSRFAVTIDYEHRQLRFSEPSTFTPPAGASVLPLHFNGNLPIVHASATMPDGRSFDVRMLVDTGARQALVLNRPFLEKNHLFDAVPNAIEGPLGAGVGGATSQKIGRVRSLELAGFVIDAPVTSFATSTAGADADPDVDGLIGGEILRRFTVVIDYSHDRFLLARNAAFDEPFEYDMSGMLLVAADAQMNRFVVKSVLPSSPAAEAGVVANDELQSIDDRPASESNLNDIRAQFMRAGTYRLTLIRDGKPMNVTLTTRRLV